MPGVSRISVELSNSCLNSVWHIALNEELQTRQIPWSNCISFAADNASVMSGQHKGVIAFVKKENESI